MNILVWISGWVDSAVTAYLLQQQGHRVVWGFMLNYLEEGNPECTTKQDLESFYQVCSFLNIPYEVLDFRKEYEEKVLNYIYEGYLKGITPNPDVLCNSEVKFKLFLDEALLMGYDMIATGHYAQIENMDGEYELHRGLDPAKDQSYFLAWLNQFQLSKALFPIGGMEKTQVGNVSMSDFLQDKIGQKPWNILLEDGSIVGHHTGAYQFTIGQRRGIGLNFQAYVIDVNVADNTVVVSKDPADEKLHRSTFPLKAVSRIHEEPRFPMNAWCKVRYRQDLQECTIEKKDNQIVVQTKTPQKGVPNWQICVMYAWEKGDTVMGCGEITQ